MSSSDDLRRVLRLIDRHSDLLIEAHLKHHGEIDDAHLDAIESLISARLLWRPASDEPARLTRELAGLFDRVLRDPRRTMVNADVAGYLDAIEESVIRYREAKRRGIENDIRHYRYQIEQLVDDLRSYLIDSSHQLWQKISTEFGYVTALEAKIKENEHVLAQSRQLNDSLEIIRVSKLAELAGTDRELRRYLLRWLLDAVERCRKETADAIHKLNAMLFEQREKQRLTRLVDSFYSQYQNNPGYEPEDYTAGERISSLFAKVAPLELRASLDVEDIEQELSAVDIISGLRKERPSSSEQASEPVDVAPDPEPIVLEPPALARAVDTFYREVLEAEAPLSVIQKSPPPDIEPDPELWVYAVISRYHNMSVEDQGLFELLYEEAPDPVFDGYHRVHDVRVAFRGGL